MPEPLIATEDIPFFGVLAFTAGQIVPDDWAELHPDLADGRTARRTPELVEEVTPGAYDPGEHTVDEVLAHLADVDQAERDRIVAAETAGKNRKGITDAGQEG
jgi:hypothetical protein